MKIILCIICFTISFSAQGKFDPMVLNYKIKSKLNNLENKIKNEVNSQIYKLKNETYGARRKLNTYTNKVKDISRKVHAGFSFGTGAVKGAVNNTINYYFNDIFYYFDRYSNISSPYELTNTLKNDIILLKDNIQNIDLNDIQDLYDKYYIFK